MKNKNILISGAGIAGLTLAYFLQQNGFQPVVIEKAPELPVGGYMIDFFSSGISVSKKIGILDDLIKIDHRTTCMKQFTAAGKKGLTLNIENVRKQTKGGFFNFLRSDLARILYDKVKENVDIRFGTSVTEVIHNEDGLQIIFNDNSSQQFDLLVGADGFHSNIRQLTYQPNEVDYFHLGYYIAGTDHAVPLDIKPREFISMLNPKHQLMSYEMENGGNTTLFIFKSPKLGNLTTSEKIQVVKDNFKDFADSTPEILKQIEGNGDLFFDEVSQIRLQNNWSKGRTVLVGDAAYCLTLLSGQGASMAMTGAYVLAEKLAESQGNYQQAFSNYETDLRPKIEKMQKRVVKNAGTFLPSSKMGLAVRNIFLPLFFTKLLTPVTIKLLGATNYFEE